MNTDAFKTLLNEWQQHCSQQPPYTSCQLDLMESDLVKLDALAATFNLKRNEVAAQLLHLAIQTAEERMPYIPGPNVIRIEEGEEIYEDCGPMPRYMTLKKTLEQKRSFQRKRDKT